ncbi:hypothetical protein FRC20_005476, partial [Serendipita sp. 405]
MSLALSTTDQRGFRWNHRCLWRNTLLTGQDDSRNIQEVWAHFRWCRHSTHRLFLSIHNLPSTTSSLSPNLQFLLTSLAQPTSSLSSSTIYIAMYASLCATVAYWSLVSAVPVEFQFPTSPSLDQESDESPSGKPIMGEAGLSLITLSALFPILLIISCLLYGIVRRRYSQTGEHLLCELDFISKGLDANADSRQPQERASADTFNLQSNSKLQVVSEQKPFAKAAPSATSLPLPERALLPN